MGIVKISDDLHDQIRLSSSAMSRSINAQAEHWLRVGQLAENHPHLNYAGICALLLAHARKADEEGLSAAAAPVRLVGSKA
ncbi:ParD-like family protein [Diaphorobacter caeni]|uniref:ParD-like family protein n=1 Tax=Diaphorobacter caeni TaxID=2784387 RepID=UPI00188E0628|nr:ParD-like family protein [Diaphorobacter caeni]MBF5005514.1 ParD-like family protein [Diaphorobacter caeni]